MAPAWVIRNAFDALNVFRTYAADMRAKGILSAAQWADKTACGMEDRLAGREPFPNYRSALEHLSRP